MGDAMLLGLNHLGIVVRDLEAALPFYVETLGLAAHDREDLPVAGVRVLYVETGSGTIQLLQPIGPGPARDYLDQHGEGPDHICYTVADIPAALAVLAPDVTVPIFLGGRGRRACFLPGRHHGLRIELTEAELYTSP
ncbi:MAG: VOC family protein [Chloroflexota bacterium]|nr:VOC family protein [Chloroflexota bacterium]